MASEYFTGDSSTLTEVTWPGTRGAISSMLGTMPAMNQLDWLTPD